MTKRILLLLFLLLYLFTLGNKRLLAQSLDCQDISDLPQKITCLENKTKDLQGQEKTLSSQIAVFDNQIRLTEYRIEATEQQISDLVLDIDTTTKKIGGLEKTLDTLAGVLANRIVATYEVGRIQPLHILLTSDSISNFFSRLNYLKIAQQHDKKLIYNTQQAKNDYANQKDIFEAKKRKVESLKRQLEAYTAQLEKDKRAKNDLLAVTRNDEKQYRILLDTAKRELAALAGSQFSEKKEVKRGDAIGLMGSTGFSTGPHLHFGYYNLTEEEHNNLFKGNIGWYSTRNTNPEDVLQNRSLFFYKLSCNDVQSDQFRNIGNGSFPWPLGNPYITQCYGSTPYSSVYANGIHEGLDMATNGSVIITAAEDGVAYFYRGNTSFGNNVRIFHSNGKMSLYLHLQ